MTSEGLSSRDDFEAWLASMDDLLEEFLDALPPNIKWQLDYSSESLGVLESWILETYPSVKEMLPKDQVLFTNGLAAYIGETFRRALGGRWTIRFDDPDYVFFGLPILAGAKGQKTDRCPFSLATTAADRRTGVFLRNHFDKATAAATAAE